jgi:UDP-glucose 4-epimerase
MDFVDEDSVVVVVAAPRLDLNAPQTFRENTQIALNVGELMKARKFQKCVYFSSASVYGDAHTNLAIDEGATISPTSCYGAAKASGEMILEAAAQTSGVALAILRPCRIYGPGDVRANYGPSRIIRSIVERGCVELYGDGEEMRDHVFVDDAARIAAWFVMNSASGVYNLASGVSHSYMQIVEILRRIVSEVVEVGSVQRTRPHIDQGFSVARLEATVPDLKFTEFEEGCRRTLEFFRSVDHKLEC